MVRDPPAGSNSGTTLFKLLLNEFLLVSPLKLARSLKTSSVANHFDVLRIFRGGGVSSLDDVEVDDVEGALFLFTFLRFARLHFLGGVAGGVPPTWSSSDVISKCIKSLVSCVNLLFKSKFTHFFFFFTVQRASLLT